MWIMRIGMSAGLAMLAGFGPAAGPGIRSVIPTRTGIDCTFRQTIKRIMDGNFGTFDMDRRFLFDVFRQPRTLGNMVIPVSRILHHAGRLRVGPLRFRAAGGLQMMPQGYGCRPTDRVVCRTLEG